VNPVGAPAVIVLLLALIVAVFWPFMTSRRRQRV
jgi:hypothetical protein